MNYNVSEFKKLVLTKCFNIKLRLLTKMVGDDEVLKLELLKKLVGKVPVAMNMYITSDVIDYNANRNVRTIFVDNQVKHVSSRQSFVLNPHNTTYV